MSNNELQELYKLDEVYEFKIVNVFPNCCKLIELQNGVDTYLRNTANLNLKKNQIIKCRVIGADSKRPFVNLVDANDYKKDESKITEESLLSLIKEENIGWNFKDFARLILSNLDDNAFEINVHKWIQQQLNKKIALSTIKDDCAKLLEDSDFLNLCSLQEREFYQDRLTLVLELIEYYIAASDMVKTLDDGSDKDLCNDFIENLYAKLKTSGFIYHPQRNLNILICLFQMRPDIMNRRIRELLDIIDNREYAIWSLEPFNNAMIKVLELFISHNEDQVDKIKDNGELVDNLLFALHLQLFLIGKNKTSDDIDLRMIQARICLFSTYLGMQSKADLTSLKTDLINSAFHNLYNSQITNFVLPKKEYKNTPHKIQNYKLPKIDSKLRYTNKDVKIDVSSEGLSLFSDASATNLRPVFPRELGLWNNLQIFWSNRDGVTIPSAKVKDLNLYTALWNDIETEFMTIKQTNVETTPKKAKRYRTGEYVLISFIRQDDVNKEKFYCRIEDGSGVEGFIYLSDIVNYPVNVCLRDFYDPEDGNRYVFNARIEEVIDGNYHFSMLEDIFDVVNDGFYGEDEEVYCFLGNDPIYLGGHLCAVAVTKEGLGISLQVDDFPKARQREVVKCRVIGPGSDRFNLVCRMTGYAEGVGIYKADGFRELMRCIYEDKITENAEQQPDGVADIADDNISPLEEKYLRETIFLIDRMACIENDYVKSYNYLGFARILCLLLNMNTQAAYYKGRMDIISNLHYFARYKEIDESKLKQLAEANAELLSDNNILKERFMQLQTVSYKDKPQHNADLFEIMKSNSNLKDLAALVLAYNIAKQSGLDRAANDFYNNILRKLEIRGYETGLKEYGAESDVIEFKTSIVFPAGRKGMEPNFNVQIKEILKVVNAFLNSSGGTLYIGVEDSGLGVGLDNDLRTPDYNGDKDKYIRSIQDAIAATWGNFLLSSHIDIRYDDDNRDKDVVIVKVKQHDEGLPYDNIYWVKTNSSKHSLSRKEFEKYKKLGRGFAQ